MIVAGTDHRPTRLVLYLLTRIHRSVRRRAQPVMATFSRRLPAPVLIGRKAYCRSDDADGVTCIDVYLYQFMTKNVPYDYRPLRVRHPDAPVGIFAGDLDVTAMARHAAYGSRGQAGAISGSDSEDARGA
jgi:hypothetical protein